MLIAFALLGCNEEDTASASAAGMEEDIAATARVVEEIGLQPTTVEDCYDGPGDCVVCYSASGTPLSGTFTAGAEDTCAVSLDTTAGTSTYTLTASSYSGSWETTAAGVVVTASGTRTTEVEGARGRGSNPAVLTVDEATLTVDGTGEVTDFTLVATYQGTGGRTYAIDLVESAAGLEGVVTASEVTCTVAGTRDAPALDCER